MICLLQLLHFLGQSTDGLGESYHMMGIFLPHIRFSEMGERQELEHTADGMDLDPPEDLFLTWGCEQCLELCSPCRTSPMCGPLGTERSTGAGLKFSHSKVQPAPRLLKKEIRRGGLPNRLRGALVRFHGFQEGKRP